jgi:hypothetical protein
MWVTRVRELPDGEEMIWTEPAPSERELFARDPRRIVLETRSDASLPHGGRALREE